ncbi:MAG: hypothetical protein WC639_00605 [Patescibacteria group bacterium]|jgi:hypothetical protein
MKNLSTLEQYNKLYTEVVKIVNKIDPCFYSGPEDEYDYNVNQLLSFIRDHQINLENFDPKLKIIFFGQNAIEKEESERLLHLSQLLKSLLSDWL